MTQTTGPLPDHLFVYGTLLTVADHPLGNMLRTQARLIGPGHIRARLYIIEEEDAQGHNSFPGALPSMFDQDQVHGELYSLTNPAPLIAAFNDYEACSPIWPEPYEFLLRPIDVTLSDGTVQRAATYLYTHDVSRARHIPSGRFNQVASDTR